MKFSPTIQHKLTARTVDAGITRFIETGNSSHSINGAMLAHILNYCVDHNVPFTLTYQPGMGYYVQQDPQVRVINGRVTV